MASRAGAMRAIEFTDRVFQSRREELDLRA
jgi:hypothetical protein